MKCNNKLCDGKLSCYASIDNVPYYSFGGDPPKEIILNWTCSKNCVKSKKYHPPFDSAQDMIDWVIDNYDTNF